MDNQNNEENDTSEKTTAEDYAKVGDIALLEVVSIEKVGVFLDWGLPKDLFLPFAEQINPLKPGDMVLVYIYQDQQQRFCASQKIESFLKQNEIAPDLKPEQLVDLIIMAKTDIGYKAIINSKYIGVLYSDEVFSELHYGEKTKGFVKKIRPDHKIDLRLLKAGHQAADDIGPLILEKLKNENGFLAINEKTNPEVIYKMFGVSKKKYKIILGGLYKKRLIRIEKDGIYLV